MSAPKDLEKRVEETSLALNTQATLRRERGLRLLSHLDALRDEVLRVRGERDHFREEAKRLQSEQARAFALLECLLQEVEAQQEDETMLEVEARLSSMNAGLEVAPVDPMTGSGQSKPDQGDAIDSIMARISQTIRGQKVHGGASEADIQSILTRVADQVHRLSGDAVVESEQQKPLVLLQEESQGDEEADMEEEAAPLASTA